MGKKAKALIGAGLVGLLLTGTHVGAELYRVQFDARTVRSMQQDGSTSSQMQLTVEAWDTELTNPPDFVYSITVVAPDNSTFQMNTAQHWYGYTGDRYYDAWINPNQFKSGNIVGGTYQCTVRDITNKSITVKDKVGNLSNLPYLTPAQIISPVGGSLNVTDPLFIKWSAVKGAARYGIRLWNNTSNEPVIWYYRNPLWVTGTEITLPTGTLKPNSNYRLMIDARDELLDCDRRSRSKWIYFTTGSW